MQKVEVSIVRVATETFGTDSVFNPEDGLTCLDERHEQVTFTEGVAALVDLEIEYVDQLRNLEEVVLQTDGHVSSMGLFGKPTVERDLVLCGETEARGLMCVGVDVVGIHTVTTHRGRHIEEALNRWSDHRDLADIEIPLIRPVRIGSTQRTGREVAFIGPPSFKRTDIEIAHHFGAPRMKRVNVADIDSEQADIEHLIGARHVDRTLKLDLP